MKYEFSTHPEFGFEENYISNISITQQIYSMFVVLMKLILFFSQFISFLSVVNVLYPQKFMIGQVAKIRFFIVQ